MPLEAVMICVDNSDYTRNGDYAPTRFDSQTDAVNLVCGAKTQQNIENSVGILTTAGDRIEVKITPTSDLGKLVSELPKINVGGMSDLMRGIQTAQLALKHRQNKNQKQRIIAFVGSPVTATEKELETLGKNLKKNNVSLDLVSFGEVEENTPKLEKLLNAVNSNESSHLVEIPVGPKLLSDVLLGSPVINADGEAGVAGAGGGEGFEFGINPNEDPELALALRISMEEERARQQAANPAPEGAAAPAGDAAAAAAAAPAAAPAAGGAAALPAASDAAVIEAMGMEDMDEELRQALLLSMQDAQPGDAPAAAPAAPAAAEPAAAPAPAAQESTPAPAAAAPAAAPATDVMEGLPDDMDEELKKALELSMMEADPPAAAPVAAESAPAAAEPAKDAEMKDATAASTEDAKVEAKWFQDPTFVNELLGSLPGVDINDPRIQSALKEVSTEEKEAEKDKDASGSGGDGAGSGDKGELS